MNINEYLHLYIGGVCQNIDTGEKFGLSYNMTREILSGRVNAKLLLRKLPDGNKYCDMVFLKNRSIGATEQSLEQIRAREFENFRLLLKQRFDLFGLIDKGFAIEDPLLEETLSSC